MGIYSENYSTRNPSPQRSRMLALNESGTHAPPFLFSVCRHDWRAWRHTSKKGWAGHPDKKRRGAIHVGAAHPKRCFHQVVGKVKSIHVRLRWVVLTCTRGKHVLFFTRAGWSQFKSLGLASG